MFQNGLVQYFKTKYLKAALLVCISAFVIFLFFIHINLGELLPVYIVHILFPWGDCFAMNRRKVAGGGGGGVVFGGG